RRRHTRCYRDWSSDVCSSDLNAMYRAKSRGKNRFEYFVAEMDAPMPQRLEVETYLRRALERGEFSLHYQPQFDLRSGRLVGQERSEERRVGEGWEARTAGSES